MSQDDQDPAKRVPRVEVFRLGAEDLPGPIRDMLESINSDRNGAIDKDALTNNRAQTLRSLSTYMSLPRDYEEGDIVRFKAGLNNSRIQNLAIVRKIYTPETMLYAPNGNSPDAYGSPLFHEPLDVILGVLTEQGNFLEYHTDGRRLERVPEDELT